MFQLGGVGERENENLKRNWKNAVYLPDKCTSYNKKYLNMFAEFQFMWDRHLRQLNIAEHALKFISEYKYIMHSAPWWAKPNECEFERAMIDETLLQQVIGLAHAIWMA